MKKSVAKCLVLFFASLLVLLLVQEILTTMEQVSNVFSSVEFSEVKNGLYESSIFLVAVKTVKNLKPLLLDYYCNCTKKFSTSYGDDLKLHQPCKQFSGPFPNDINYVRKETMSNSTFFLLTLIECPMDFERGEFIHVLCHFPESNILATTTFPLNFDQGVQALADTKLGMMFADKYFKTRPQKLLSGGQKILFKLSSQVFEVRKFCFRNSADVKREN